jgi:pseudaminic acid biosynthesis-associated methylase
MPEFKTEQEQFWAGDFGLAYIERNKSERLLQSNIFFWRRVLQSMPRPASIGELGCNIGMNFRALHAIDPEFKLTGYEINEAASAEARALGYATINTTTILEPLADKESFDLTYTKGVLIHINPDHLTRVYDNLVKLSREYVLITEYYNPTPVNVDYRSHSDRLFKRDFAGEIMDRHGLRLVDYGFVYHRDSYAPQDDITWFLMKKA